MDLKDLVRAEVRIQIRAEDDLIRKPNSVKSEFKQFDSIDDSWFTDHHFYYRHPKNFGQQFIERLSYERDILKEGLTDSIFVRANEEKPDLLKAVIIGPQGTPHQDGLFFFDIYFPSNFPNVPPIIRSIHAHGLKHYCIPQPYYWSLSRSLLLKSLLEIHQRIVTRSEYIPFDAGSQLRDFTEKDDVLKFNWRTMIRVLEKPPMYFEKFVVDHFYDRAEKILVACESYIRERVNTVDHPIIMPPWQVEFDMMKSLYCKLVDAFQKNVSSLGDLCKLRIEYRGPGYIPPWMSHMSACMGLCLLIIGILFGACLAFGIFD